VRGVKMRPNLFIGARKNGSAITVFRETVVDSPTGKHLKIVSTKRTLRKRSSPKAASLHANWMDNPQLGDRLEAAFAKAVKAAKTKHLASQR
jgi:hypothetical protein